MTNVSFRRGEQLPRANIPASAVTSGSARPKAIAGTASLCARQNQWPVRRVHAGSQQQQGRHQLAVADQFIGQGCRCRQRCRLRQNSDVFQQAFNLFANDIRMTQTISDIELDFYGWRRA